VDEDQHELDRGEPEHFDERREHRRVRRSQYDDQRDDYDDEFGYGGFGDPRAKVRAPGMAMMVIGILGIVVSIGMLALGIIVPIAQLNQQGGGAADAIPFAVIFGVFGLFSLAACIVVTLGGRRMRECRNWGLALTAAILILCSLLLSLCNVLIMPFGIWALVVLCNGEVQREFAKARRAGEFSAYEGE
jgi:hypothetical protein